VSSPLSTEEIVVAPPIAVQPVTQVRGTLITASLQALSERALLDRYYAALPAAHHVDVRGIIASSWVPEPLANVHYRACDALGLPASEVLAIGGAIGIRMKETFLGTILRASREVGTTPWSYFHLMPRLFARVTIGGGCGIYKLGPKEARAEWYGLPGLAIPYFKLAFRGAHHSIVELFCQKAYVSETKALRGGDWAFKASWV
jgi:hypothetical protein